MGPIQRGGEHKINPAISLPQGLSALTQLYLSIIGHLRVTKQLMRSNSQHKVLKRASPPEQIYLGNSFKKPKHPRGSFCLMDIDLSDYSDNKSNFLRDATQYLVFHTGKASYTAPFRSLKGMGSRVPTNFLFLLQRIIQAALLHS